MEPQVPALPLRAGDSEGRDTLYTRPGALIGEPGESYLDIVDGWDMNVRCPWRKFLPGIIFMGFNGRVESKLYITSNRIVLLREIDSWREVAGELTPLGTPTAVAKEVRLKELKQAGVRQFCEIHPKSLRLISAKKFVKRGCRLDLRLIGDDRREYAVSFWKTDGRDAKTLSLIEAQFHR